MWLSSSTVTLAACVMCKASPSIILWGVYDQMFMKWMLGSLWHKKIMAGNTRVDWTVLHRTFIVLYLSLRRRKMDVKYLKNWGWDKTALSLQTTSHYLGNWCLISLSHICVTRPQWVNTECVLRCRLFSSVDGRSLLLIRINFNLCVTVGNLQHWTVSGMVLDWYWLFLRKLYTLSIDKPMMISLLTHICVTRPHELT